MNLNKANCSCPLNTQDNTPLSKIPRKLKSPYFKPIPSQRFFRCRCENSCSPKKRLNMPGNILNETVGRLLRDTDIPALLIFLKKNQDVTSVNLAHNALSDAGFINLIDHSILHRNISELHIQNNYITEKGINYMFQVGKRVPINDLRLKGNKFGVEGSKKLALFLLKNSCIVRLDTADVDQTASSLIYFPMVLSSDQDDHNKTLKSLDISRPLPGCMHYFDSQHFASVIGHMLRHNTTLAELRLQKYGFSCHDMESMMSNAKYNNSLQILDLSSNNIGDHGVEYFANWLKQRPALRALILRANIITDHGTRALSFAMPFSRILALDLSNNKITDDGIVDLLNSLKKSPLLRELRIFGNCIGHPSAEIVNRMLMSKVLNQENIDVRPYWVDHRWHFARYQSNRGKEKYDDVPYSRSSKAPGVVSTKIKSTKKYYKYVFSKMTKTHLQRIVDCANIESISNTSSKGHEKDCTCCYCFKCGEINFNELCRDADHPDDCTCCQCETNSSDLSLDTTFIAKNDPTATKSMENIASILKHVNSETRAKIIRWINIDEDILNKDLQLFTGEDDAEAEDFGTESNVSCNCSWIALSISMVQKYLDGIPLKDLICTAKKKCFNLEDVCGTDDCKIFNDSTIEPCINISRESQIWECEIGI